MDQVPKESMIKIKIRNKIKIKNYQFRVKILYSICNVRIHYKIRDFKVIYYRVLIIQFIINK